MKVAAVDEPKLHLWETGIMRVTRHPQMVGQALWCAAHTLWVGSSVMVAASAGLMAHHLFAVWHGDKRLRDKYGEVKSVFGCFSSCCCFGGREGLAVLFAGECLAVRCAPPTAPKTNKTNKKTGV